QLVLARREIDWRPAHRRDAAYDVERHRSQADHPGRIGGLPGGPAEERRDSGPKLGEPEGLRHVVVRAGFEGGHLVALGATRRENEDGGRRFAADPTDDGSAVAVRQSQVEQDEIRSLGIPAPKRRRDVSGLRDAVAVGCEVRDDRATHRLVVLDEQQMGSAVQRGVRAIAALDPAASSGSETRADPNELASSPGGVAATGNSTTIPNPPRGLGLASTLPPIPSARPRTTASPIPRPRREPPPLRSTRKNLSNSRGSDCAGTPGPPSSTTSRISPFPVAAEMAS